MPVTGIDQTEFDGAGGTPVAPEPTRQRGLRFRSRLVAAFATLGLVVTLVGTTAAPASATTIQPISGRPGLLSTYQVEGLSIQTATKVVPGMKVNSPYIYRSPATSGTQTVRWSAQTQRWNGYTWVDSYSMKSGDWRISAGNSWTRPYNFQFELVQAGYYRVFYVVAWFDTASGQLIGSSSVSMFASGDYACRSSFYVNCTAGPGYVYLA